MFETHRHTFDAWTRNWTTSEPTTYQGSDELAFQRWFKFKEAFSPSLVLSVINELKEKPRHILDCCAGSGTTGVVAQFLGIQSTLIEVNPFIADIIEAKMSDYRHIDLLSAADEILHKSNKKKININALRKRLPPTFIEPGVNGRWIFSEETAQKLESYRQAINVFPDPIVRKLFSTALGSILIEVSNVRIDGKGRRYRKNWQERTISKQTVRELFLNAIRQIVGDIYKYAKVERAKFNLLRGDSRTQISAVNAPVDLVLFSPPYPNSFDYTDIYNIELWMLGYFSNFDESSALRHATLRSHVQCSWQGYEEDLGSETLNFTLNKLEKVKDKLWSKRLPTMINSYFHDMQILMEESRKKMRQEGLLAMVVGNSSYGNVQVDVPKILCEIGKKIGFNVHSCKSVREMRLSSQQSKSNKNLTESIVILSL